MSGWMFRKAIDVRRSEDMVDRRLVLSDAINVLNDRSAEAVVIGSVARIFRRQKPVNIWIKIWIASLKSITQGHLKR